MWQTSCSTDQRDNIEENKTLDFVFRSSFRGTVIGVWISLFSTKGTFMYSRTIYFQKLHLHPLWFIILNSVLWNLCA
jgi:hypothetical protein